MMEGVLSFDKNQLAKLFRRTFGPSSLDNFQITLTCQRLRDALPVRDKLTRYDGFFSPTFPKWEQGRENILHALVQC